MSHDIAIRALMASSGVGFGTSGARGLVVNMTDELCWAYTLAFLQKVVPAEAHSVVLGHDLRPSSPALARACATAIEASGREVVFAGAVPTPALAFYALNEGVPAIMVTGSHIPFDRNGIKFYTANGEISKTDEAAITAAQVMPMGTRSLTDLTLSPDVLAAFAERYRRFFPADFLIGHRIGLYEHSGVARDFLRQLLQGFGAEVISLGRTDDFVPVDTEAVSAADQAMAKAWAAEFKFDALLSTDGDADRPLIGDETGQWLRGDIVGLLCAQYLGARVVVTPVSSNTAIEHCGAFDSVMRTRIGSPYVIAGMEAALAAGHRAVVGFEANGGFLTGDALQLDGRPLAALPTRDAVLPMLCLLAFAQNRGVPLSQLSSPLPSRHTASDRLKDFPSTASQTLLAQLAAAPPAIAKLLGELCGAVASLDQTDGLRITFANAEIIHLRPSGNAPELRCYAEADTDQRAQQLVEATLARVLAQSH